MHKISDIIKTKSFVKDPKNKYEFQAYGNRLAEELGDPSHRSLYIKLAKSETRALLECARDVALMSNESNKGRIFMWKLSELKKSKKTVTI